MAKIQIQRDGVTREIPPHTFYVWEQTGWSKVGEEPAPADEGLTLDFSEPEETSSQADETGEGDFLLNENDPAVDPEEN
jgi:hypothetical protein